MDRLKQIQDAAQRLKDFIYESVPSHFLTDEEVEQINEENELESFEEEDDWYDYLPSNIEQEWGQFWSETMKALDGFVQEIQREIDNQ